MEEIKKDPLQKEVGTDDEYRRSVFVPMTKQKGKNECVQCDFLESFIIENNNDDQIINIFTLVVYGTLIFSQSSRYVDATVVDLIEQIENQVNPVPAIVVETIRSLNYCRKKGKGDFIGYVQLLYIWIQSHF